MDRRRFLRLVAGAAAALGLRKVPVAKAEAPPSEAAVKWPITPITPGNLEPLDWTIRAIYTEEGEQPLGRKMWRACNEDGRFVLYLDESCLELPNHINCRCAYSIPPDYAEWLRNGKWLIDGEWV